MQPKHKHLGADQQMLLLEANVADYLLVAAAVAVPLYTSGLSIQQPAAGVIFVFFSWLGLAISYLVRVIGVPASFSRNIGWIFLGVALLIAFNYRELNSRLPGGGFDWHMTPASFLCWFIVVASYFLWTDDAMLFLLVPGIALFGVQSYIESARNFESTLILFMVSVAVLLTRLHLRVMYAAARAAGYYDVHALYAGPWRAVAGPFLAVFSVLVVAACSFVLAPGLGGAVRTLAGDPQIKFEATPAGPTYTGLVSVARRIGAGPVSASNLIVLKVKTKDTLSYLRSRPLRFYKKIGWTEDTSTADALPVDKRPESNLPGVSVYTFTPREFPLPKRTVTLEVESVNRTFLYALSPGPALRLEYDGTVALFLDEFPMLTDLLTRGSKYYLRAGIPESNPDILRAAKPTDRATVAKYYAASGRDLISSRVKVLAEKTVANARTDYDAVQALVGEIGVRCKYNLKAARIEGDQDRVEAFLFETREGYCDLFASALTVMCRAIGLRARPMLGYLVEPSDKQGSEYIVRDRHAHMWTEVFFDGVGWVPFDATEKAEEVPGGGRDATLDEESTGPVYPWAAWVGGGVLFVSFLALVIGWSLSWYRGIRVASPELRRLRPLYLKFLRILQTRIKRPKMPGETTAEYAQAFAAETRNGINAVRIAAAFDSAFYGAVKPATKQIETIREMVLSLQSEVRANGNQKGT